LNHSPGLHFLPWGSPPEQQGFQGGDLLGIVDRLDYLQDLGINALYLNPVFSSAANHRYHPYDHFQVDPLLGGEAALRELIDAVHTRGMRIILDGVFNHASRGFWPFHHILENGKKSPYIDWFIIEDFPLRPYSSGPGKPANYASWWGQPALPKLNTRNPGVREYLFKAGQHWIEFGADGWRLDVPAEIDDDSFWQEFRRVVKSANPEAYIVGEIWHAAQRWLGGDQFDGVMNYFFAKAAISFFAKRTLNPDNHHPDLKFQPELADKFRDRLDWQVRAYDWEIVQTQLNMLDSHDSPRALWMAGGDISALRLAVLLQMTMPGAPCIYYGNEVGLTGGPDPLSRAAFPWHTPESWDRDLLSFYRQAIALRRNTPALRTGQFYCLHAEGEQYIFLRQTHEQSVLVAFNAGDSRKEVPLATGRLQGRTYRQVWPVAGNLPVPAYEETISLSLPARDALILVNGDSG